MLTRHGAWTRLEMRLPESAYAPCGFAAGDTNLFRYVGNSPTNQIDPSGLKDITVTGPNGVTAIVRASIIPVNQKIGRLIDDNWDDAEIKEIGVVLGEASWAMAKARQALDALRASLRNKTPLRGYPALLKPS